MHDDFARRDSEYNRRTGCGKTARPGLCRGRRVTGVPTARGVNRARAVGLCRIRQCRTLCRVRTVIETSVFVRYAAEVWSDAERVEFISWIAANPESGDVRLRSGGCRKVRWLTAGTGKRGGARVVYFLEREHTVLLLIVYKKAKFDNLPSEFLAELKKGIEDAV